jgi:glycosyltransferase involved in cell wall biosynthesis
MPGRIVFDTLPHDELPKAYAAADVFVLGSLFETFGVVYIEAMAMGLPVVCTHHPNQRSIVGDGIFIDMARSGELAAVLQHTPRDSLRDLGRRGAQTAREKFDLQTLKARYLDAYARVAASPVLLPRNTLGRRLRANLRNAWTGVARVVG